jgi:PAS domain S-box-containing protein
MPETASSESRLALLVRLVESITASPDLDQVLVQVVQSATRLVDGALSTLWIVEGPRLVARARAGVRRHPPVRTEFALGEGHVGRVALEQRTIHVRDILTDPHTADRDYFAAEGAAALAAIPLTSHGQFVGVLALVTRAPRELTIPEIEMLTAFGGHAAIAIQSARLYADAERRRREAETLADVARDLADHHDLDLILARIARGANDLCGADATGLALRVADGSYPVRHMLGVRGNSYRQLALVPGLGIGGLALTRGRPVQAPDRDAWPLAPAEHAAARDAEGIQSGLAVPILVDGQVEGVLYVCSRAPRSFGDGEQAVLVRLADHAAAAIDNHRLFAAEQAARMNAQASARNYLELVDTLDAIVLDADAETFQVSFVNQRAEAILGYARQDWYTDPQFWAKHVHPADRDSTAAECKDAIAQGRDHAMEYRMLTADGRVVWMHDMVRVLPPGQEGGPRQLRSVMVDISERKHAEAMLAGEREILGLIATGAPLVRVLDALCRLIESLREDLVASVLLVEEGRLRHGASPSLPRSATAAIDGLPVGPTAGSCGTAAHRKETVIVSDIATDPLWAEYRDLVLPLGLRACWSVPVLNTQGEVFATFALYRRVPGTPNRQEMEMVALATDLISVAGGRDQAAAALRRSEEQHRALVTHIPAVTWLADAQRKVAFVSPNAAQITGFAAEELTAGGLEGWLARIHPDDAATVRQRYTALESDRQPFDVEYRLRHRHGHWVWIHDRAMSAYEQDDTVYYAGLLTDITARKQAEIEVQQQRQLLAHLTRVATLGELSGALAHELSQPLTSILSNAQAAQLLLAQAPVDLGELREILVDIVHEDRRAGEVIGRLRALLRRGETPHQLLEVNDLIMDVLRLANSELIAHGVPVTTDLAAGLPKIRGDRVALQQVLLNLILNACEAMRSEPLESRQLTALTGRDGDDMVRVAIVDHGVGLPADSVERVFEPFFTTKEQGLGLGLVICRTIVAAHGGRLGATGNGGRGATFAFTLPAALPDACVVDT